MFDLFGNRSRRWSWPHVFVAGCLYNSCVQISLITSSTVYISFLVRRALLLHDAELCTPTDYACIIESSGADDIGYLGHAVFIVVRQPFKYSGALVEVTVEDCIEVRGRISAAGILV